MQAAGSEAQESGKSASETKQKYTLKSEGGGTYKVAGGQQINVSTSRHASSGHQRRMLSHAANQSSARCTLHHLERNINVQVATAGVNAFVR